MAKSPQSQALMEAERPKAAQQRRREILEAAARIFHEKGYEATSIQDIAEAVGILKGSLYYYIDSKEDLLFALIQEVHEEALTDLERWRSMEGNALVKIRAFVQAHVMNNARNIIKTAVFFHDFRSLGPERRAVIVAERDTYDRFLRDLITQGQKEKVICPDINPKLAAIAIFGMMNWLYHWYRPAGGTSAPGIATEYADLVLQGLVCHPSTHRSGHRSKLGALAPEIAEGILSKGRPRRLKPRRA